MWTSWWTGSPAASPLPAERHAEAGFTLLEVLVAFAILAVAMAAVLQAFGGGLDAVRRTEAASQSWSAARSLLDRVGPELPIVPGMRSGTDEAGSAWTVLIGRRKSALDQMKGAERPYALFDVLVTVEAAGTAPATLQTVRLAPAP
jgi:general secretion pathway protein I